MLDYKPLQSILYVLTKNSFPVVGDVMYASGPSDITRSSSNDNNSDVCNFDDHPYSSPDEDSDNDGEIVEMNFSVFSMADNFSTVQQETNSAPSNETNIRHGNSETICPSVAWCKCGNCTDCIKKEAVCCQDKPEVLDIMDSIGGCVTEEAFFNL